MIAPAVGLRLALSPLNSTMNWRLPPRKARNIVAVIFSIFIFLEPALSQESIQTTKDRPLLEIDLRKFGYEAFPFRWHLHKAVDFTDSSHIAVAWVTGEHGSVRKQGKLATGQLHVTILDARTGQQQGSHAWPPASVPFRFLGVRDGKFLIGIGGTVRLVGPTFEVIHEENLGTDSNCPICGELTLSVNRRVLLLSRRHPGPNYANKLVESETFSSIADWSESLAIADISESRLLAYCGKPREVCIRVLDGSWLPFHPNGLDKETSDTLKASAHFVNDTTLLIEAWKQIVVATVDGGVLFQMDLPKNRSFGSVITSSDGERFAVIENRMRGVTNPSLDMYAFPSNDQIIVYSIPDRHAIYAVKVNGDSPWFPWESHVNYFALSPDGGLLAIISNGILKVYRLPENNSQ